MKQDLSNLGTSMPVDDERLLVSRAREGSHDAFRVLMDKHMKQAYNVAYGFVGNHDAAADVTQEAFVHAHRGLNGFRGDADFATWLHRIVMNLAMNRVKSDGTRAKREVTLTHPSAAGAGKDPVFNGGDETRAHIERALHDLPTLQRAVVILRHLDGLSTHQVSVILRCSEGTVKTHLFRGLKKMRERLHFLEADLA
jgi:RNA polymerase sigma-70 factor, ECF subfamily